MNLVSLLILPAVISLHHDTALRYVIAAVALVIILGRAWLFSKRKTAALDAPVRGRAGGGYDRLRGRLAGGRPAGAPPVPSRRRPSPPCCAGSVPNGGRP